MTRDVLISQLETIECSSDVLLARMVVSHAEATSLCMKLVALERGVIEHVVLRTDKKERWELQSKGDLLLCTLRDEYITDFKPHLSFLTDVLLNFYNEQYTEGWHWDLDMPLIERMGEVQFMFGLDFGN